MRAFLNTCSDFHMEKIATTASEFCKWVQIEISVYILFQKYHIKLHSSLWLSDALAVANAQRNHFPLQQPNKSFMSKASLRQHGDFC